MIVLLLMGFVFFLSFPSFRHFIEPRDAKRAVLQFVGSLKYAQSQAAATKQVHRVNIDLRKNTFWITREGGEKNQFLPEPSSMGKPAGLPSGVVFLDVLHPDREKAREGTETIDFSPTGWAEECDVHLRRGDQEIFTVSVFPLGGKVEIGAGYLERKGL